MKENTTTLTPTEIAATAMMKGLTSRDWNAIKECAPEAFGEDIAEASAIMHRKELETGLLEQVLDEAHMECRVIVDRINDLRNRNENDSPTASYHFMWIKEEMASLQWLVNELERRIDPKIEDDGR